MDEIKCNRTPRNLIKDLEAMQIFGKPVRVTEITARYGCRSFTVYLDQEYDRYTVEFEEKEDKPFISVEVACYEE